MTKYALIPLLALVVLGCFLLKATSELDKSIDSFSKSIDNLECVYEVTEGWPEKFPMEEFKERMPDAPWTKESINSFVDLLVEDCMKAKGY